MAEPDEDLLREALAGMVADLTGSRRLSVIEVAASGITSYNVYRDHLAAPQGRRWAVLPWSELTGDSTSGAPGAPSPQAIIRVVDELAATATAVVCSSSGSPLARGAFELLREARPEARVFMCDGVRVDALLRDVIAGEPLRRSYDLVALDRDPMTHELRLVSHPLFPLGTLRGETCDVAVRCEPSDERGTAFAVVAWSGRKPELVSVHSAKLPPGSHKFTVVLRRPGRVQIIGVPGLVPDDRTWAELIASVPVKLDGDSGRTHLICAVELSGPRARVEERLSRIRQVITPLAGQSTGRVLVSLIAYGAHTFDRRVTDDPVEVAAWRASPENALLELDRLDRRDATPPGYPEAAQVEDMLAEVTRRLRPEGDVRTVLLTVGDRPPHPPRADSSEILPCPHRLDWEESLRLLERRPDLALGAICDRPAERAGRAWSRLGGGTPAYLDAVDVPRLALDLGLPVPRVQPIPFPFIEE